MGELLSRTGGIGAVLGVVIGSLLVWELAVLVFAPSPLILPAPSGIFAGFLEAPDIYLRHAAYTLLTTAMGFGLAVVLGVALAVGIVYSKLLERTIYTLLVALNSVPKVALGRSS